MNHRLRAYSDRAASAEDELRKAVGEYRGRANREEE